MKKRRGFTLMEIMVTVAVLAVGLTPILQAFSTSLGAFGFYADSLNTTVWIDEKIWETRHDLMMGGELPTGETSGRERIGSKEYDWMIRVAALNPDKGLYQVNLVLSWKKGQRTRSISRTAYALAPIPEDSNQAAVTP